MIYILVVCRPKDRKRKVVKNKIKVNKYNKKERVFLILTAKEEHKGVQTHRKRTIVLTEAVELFMWS